MRGKAAAYACSADCTGVAKRYRALLEAVASLLSEQSQTRKRKKSKLEDSSAADSEDEQATDKKDSSEESREQRDSTSSDSSAKARKKKVDKKKKQNKNQTAKEAVCVELHCLYSPGIRRTPMRSLGRDTGVG